MAEPSCTVTSLPIDGTSWGTSPSQGAGEWLPRKTMRRRLAAVHRQWNPIRGYDTSSLGLIQFEVWSAQVGLVPYPEVCVHTRQGVVIGVLQGGIARARRCFFIDHIAVHPNFEHDARVCEQLVELAIDRSLEEGFHGWVACIPEEGAESLWKALRFSPSSDRTYRRMGYFV